MLQIAKIWIGTFHKRQTPRWHLPEGTPSSVLQKRLVCCITAELIWVLDAGSKLIVTAFNLASTWIIAKSAKNYTPCEKLQRLLHKLPTLFFVH